MVDLNWGTMSPVQFVLHQPPEYHHQYCHPRQENTNDDVIIDVIIAFCRFEHTLLVWYLLHLPQKTSNVEWPFLGSSLAALPGITHSPPH